MRRRILSLCLWLAALLTLTAAESKWQRNVRSNKKGVVYIDRIPQVAQKKNFCAPASVEMILRYYKNRVSQRNLGRSFDSSKKSGTYTNEILKEFEQGRLKDFTIKPLYRMTVKEKTALINAYQSAVPGKRKRKSKKKDADTGADLSTMDPRIAVPIFARMRAPLNRKLSKEVMKYIDLGQPLLWCVQMNFDPSERAAGGHMRIIVGYQKSGETVRSILYRDPWGKHEIIKKMSLERAAVMTMELFLIEPIDSNDNADETESSKARK